MTQHIFVQNQSTVPVEQWLPAGKTLDDVCAALTKQVMNHFAPIWGEYASVGTSKLGDQDWQLSILDNADQAGALGYHDLDANGNPILKVFVKDTLAAKDQVTVDVSHEILETLGDYYCNLCATDSKGRVYAYECADACENETYQIDGIDVSDFVYPVFFEDVPHVSGTQFDYLGKVTAPFQLLPGGYLSYFHVGKWHQEFGSEESKQRHANRGVKPRMAKRQKFSAHGMGYWGQGGFGGFGGGWGHPVDPLEAQKRAVQQAEQALMQAITSPAEQAAQQSVSAAHQLAQSAVAAITANPTAPALPAGLPTTVSAQVTAVQTALANLTAAQKTVTPTAAPATVAPATTTTTTAAPVATPAT